MISLKYFIVSHVSYEIEDDRNIDHLLFTVFRFLLQKKRKINVFNLIFNDVKCHKKYAIACF